MKRNFVLVVSVLVSISFLSFFSELTGVIVPISAFLVSLLGILWHVEFSPNSEKTPTIIIIPYLVTIIGSIFYIQLLVTDFGQNVSPTPYGLMLLTLFCLMIWWRVEAHYGNSLLPDWIWKKL